MAVVRFVSPYHKITKTEYDNIDAKNIRELCSSIISKYGEEMSFLLDENNELSRKTVVLVNRRNAQILQGADTPIGSDTEIIIMSHLGWA